MWKVKGEKGLKKPEKSWRKKRQKEVGVSFDFFFIFQYPCFLALCRKTLSARHQRSLSSFLMRVLDNGRENTHFLQNSLASFTRVPYPEKRQIEIGTSFLPPSSRALRSSSPWVLYFFLHSFSVAWKAHKSSMSVQRDTRRRKNFSLGRLRPKEPREGCLHLPPVPFSNTRSRRKKQKIL